MALEGMLQAAAQIQTGQQNDIGAMRETARLQNEQILTLQQQVAEQHAAAAAASHVQRQQQAECCELRHYYHRCFYL
jgi:hypothetical protein